LKQRLICVTDDSDFIERIDDHNERYAHSRDYDCGSGVNTVAKDGTMCALIE
jgi:hypothetical protein